MAPIKHTYNTPLDADYSVICIDDFQFNNNVGKSLDFETRYIEDKDQTECVWVFLIFIVPCPLLDRGSSYSIDHEIDILCRKMFTGKSFETYIQGIRSKFLFQSNNNVVLSM